jgi:hypothetical protein
MYSYRQFIPGSRANSLGPDNFTKFGTGSDSASQRVSYNTRIAQLLQSGLGGKSQYGNFYLGQPLQLNYLGRNQGMPGGGGKPPVNKFN